MLQILYNKIQGNKMPKINNDCIASKLVHRGLSTLLFLAMMHSLYLLYHGKQLMCGEADASSRQEYINSLCWTVGVHVYDNYEATLPPHWTSSTDKDFEILFPGIYGRVEKEESEIPLTKFSLIPAFLAFQLILSLVGRLSWNFVQKNMLAELIGTLDCKKAPAGRNFIPKEEDRNAQVKQSHDTLLSNLRFYSTFAVQYVGCLFLNLGTLMVQAHRLISFVGNGDWKFAFNVYNNLNRRYKEWPIQHVYDFPGVAVCRYKIVGNGGNLEPKEFICALEWNTSYLKFFSFLWFFEMICGCLTILSIMFWISFLVVRKFRIFVVQKTLMLHPDSPALKGVRRLNGGTLFIIMLLNKNVRTDIVCKILGKVGMESMQNFYKHEHGL